MDDQKGLCWEKGSKCVYCVRMSEVLCLKVRCHELGISPDGKDDKRSGSEEEENRWCDTKKGSEY